MRVMVLVKAIDDSEKGFLPTTEALEALEAMGKFNEELVKAGIMLVADGLSTSASSGSKPMPSATLGLERYAQAFPGH